MVNYNQEMSQCVKNKDIEGLKFFINNPDVNPQYNYNWCLLYAARNGYIEIFDLLLMDERVELCNNNSAVFKIAANNGNIEIVKRILGDIRFFPEHLMNWVVEENHPDIIEIMMNDMKINFSVEDNMLIIAASDLGYYNIVRLLLSDDRVNPAASRNRAIYLAQINKHQEVVSLLWSDSRVKESLFNDYPEIYNELKIKDLKVKIRDFK